MIADRDTGIEVQSTVQGDKIAMGIRDEDMGHLMGVLTDLYSNKVRAVLREYPTNALDAHVDAGQTRPIEVTLPNRLAPFLKIQDWGTGLTVEDIHSIYSQYGRSTKRSSNDAVGMLGLGCKSALTYCSQFTVTSVKDGTKITVSIGRDDDGRGSMTVVDTLATTEPNGTTVTIPTAANDVWKFENEARDFFSVWTPGTVLVNGEEPTRFEGLRLSDDLFIIEEAGDSKIVMGNVAYPAPALDEFVPSGSLLAFVPIGAVNFPPSREALMDTRNTRATIDAIQDAYEKLIDGAIQREVDACSTPQDAVKVVVAWRKYVPGSSAPSAYSYKGGVLPSHFEYLVPHIDVRSGKPETNPDGTTKMVGGPLTVSTNSRYGRIGNSHETARIDVADWDKTVWVFGYTPAKFNALHKKKLLQWCYDTGLAADEYDSRQHVQQFVCWPGARPTSQFIDQARVADWEVVRKIQLQPRSTGGVSSRIPGSYDIWVEDGNGGVRQETGIPGDSLRVGLPIFYENDASWRSKNEAEALVRSYPKFTLVCLPANRIAKFKRNVPQVKTVREGIADAAKKWAAGLNADTRLALLMQDRGVKGALSALAPIMSKLTDADLTESVRVAKIDTSKQRNLRQHFSRWVSVADATQTDWDNPLDAYPLYNPDIVARHPEHVAHYINTAHAAKV